MNLLPESYWEEHELNMFSTAAISMMQYANGAMVDPAGAYQSMLGEAYEPSEEDLALEKAVRACNTPQELFRYMRKELPGLAQKAMLEQLLEKEDEVTPFLQEKVLRVTQDNFADRVLAFFIYSEVNHSRWLMDHMDEMADTFLQSQLCLVLGIRGDVSMVPFLLEKVTYFETRFPNESFAQGPLMALRNLEALYGNG